MITNPVVTQSAQQKHLDAFRPKAPISLTHLSSIEKDHPNYPNSSLKPNSLRVENIKRMSLKLSPCNSPGLNTPQATSRRVSISSKRSDKSERKDFQIKYTFV